jgi:predicted PurR-regulated permease PerM
MRADFAPWMVRGAALATGALLVYGIVTFAAMAANVLLLVLVAVLLGSALEPFVGWIRDHLPLGRGATILLVYAAFLGTVIALSFFVVPGAINQFNAAIAKLPPLIEEARAWAADIRPAALATSVGALIGAVGEAVTPEAPDPDEVVEVGLTVAEVAVSIATVLTIVFFWLVEHARLQRYALAFLPAGRRAGVRSAWNAAETRLGLWVRGQLTLMAAIGIATGIAYTVLGVPSALLLALIAALAEAIPIVGPLLGAIPAVLVAATVSPELALVVAVVYVVLQFLEGNVLVPMVMRNTVGISPFLVIISLLVGGAVGGMVGALLAVPVAAALEVVLEGLQARRVPVAQDPSSVGSSDDEERVEQAPSLPDAGALPTIAD